MNSKLPALTLPAVLALAAIALASTPLSAQTAGKSSDPARDVGRAAPGEDNSYFNANAKLRISPKQLPLNGKCIVWYPDEKGVDNYSPPQPCRPLPTVKPGGLLIAPANDPTVLEVMAYHAERPGVVVGRAAYDARTGMLMRALGPDQPLDVERRAPAAKKP